jgi:flagellar motility protein MotE (MotC chaperone)
MNANTPTLNPFSEADQKPSSSWGLVLLAVILGTATAAGVLLLKWPSVTTLPAEPPATQTKIKSQSKDWDFYTAEIDNLIQELQKQRTGYEVKTKDLGAVEMRIAAEKQELLRLREELLRLRGEIEKMRDDLTTQTTELLSTEKSNIRNLARSYAIMKPAEAVAILSQMSDANIVKLLATMKADIVAKILGEMAKTKDPAAPADSKTTLANRAATISDQLRLFKNDTAQATR